MKIKQKYLLTALLAFVFCIGGFLLLTFNNNTYDDLGFTQEYINYLNLSDEEKKTLSIIPDKYPIKLNDFDKNYMSKLNSYAQNIELPSYYNLKQQITLYTDNQSQLSICWAYAGIKSLETFLALNYGEYWNFSEGYVSYATAKNYSTYNIGDGGNWHCFVNTAFGLNLSQELGVLSETYLSTDEVYGIKRDNMHYYEYLEEYADYTYDDLIQCVNVKTDNLSVVKSHVLENGSLYSLVDSGQIKTGLNGFTVSNSTSIGSNHAVSIIGWDDNFSKSNFPENIRPSADGAYIALNSWGTSFGKDGIYYISYEDFQINNQTLHGFVKLENLEEETLIVSDITNNSSTYDKNENMNNMFNLGDEISLNFILTNTSNTSPNVGIKIKKNNIDITKSFDITNTSNIQSTNISFYHNAQLEAGTYIIELTYNNQKYIRSFYVVSGAEINYFIINRGHARMTNTINGQAKSITTNVLTKTVSGVAVKYANISININNIYCDIVEINLDNEYLFHDFSQTNSTFTYSSFYVTNQTHDINVITSNGHTETYKVIFLDGENENNYNVNYNLNGGINNVFNPKKFNVNTGFYSLCEPTRQNYTFDGWFINEISLMAQITELNNVYLGNVLLVAKWTEIFETNAFLSVEFKDVNGDIVSKDDLTYGMNATFSADFSFLNENNLTIMWYLNSMYEESYDSLNSINIKLLPGIFYVSCEATKNNELLAVQTTNYKAKKREIFLTWENYYFVYNGQNQQPDVSILGLIDDDTYELSLQHKRYNSNIVNSISVGEYTVSVTNLQNDNYILKQNTQINYTITPNIITITATDITAKFADELINISNNWTVEGTIYNNEVIIEVTTNAMPHNSGIYEIFINTNFNINYNITIINGTYTISNGNIYTYKLPDGKNTEIYVNENEESPNVNDFYTPKLFLLITVTPIDVEDGDMTYRITEFSLVPIFVVLLAIFGVIGIAISTCFIRKNKY